MGFVRSYYETESGDIMRIRLHEDTVQFAGAAPAAPANASKLPYVKITKTNREHGVRPRGAVYANEEETDSGRKAIAYRFIPLLTPAASAPNTVTIDGDVYNLVSEKGEDR